MSELTRMAIEKLPVEIFSQILAILPIESRIYLSMSSRTMRDLVTRCSWEELTFPRAHLEGLGPLITYTIAHIIPYIGPQLQSLTVTGTREFFNDSHLAQVCRFTPKLKYLDITGSNVGKNGLEFLFSTNSCPLLETLMLVNVSHLDDSVLSLIGDTCPKLKFLDVSVYSMEGRFSDHGFCQLVKGCFQLETLICNGCHSITDVTLLEMAKCCPSLNHVDFSGAFAITNDGLSNLLESCHKLESVGFSYCWRLTDEALERIAVHGNLTSALSLKHVALSFCYQLSDRLVEALCQIPSLRSVNLAYCDGISTEAKFRLLERGIHVS